MKKIFFCAALLAGLAACDSSEPKSASADAGAADAAVVVNGVAIGESRLRAYAPGGELTDENRDQIIENVISSELIAQAAEELGLHEDAETREQIAVARQTVLGRAFVNHVLGDAPPDEAAIAARYEQIKAQYQGQREYLARHILTESEEEIREIADALAADPAQFETLARERSADPGSAQNGGLLGWSAADVFVPEFASALRSLDAGETTPQPIKSDFGWHLIRVDETRPIAVPELNDEMRDRLRLAIERESFSARLQELREKATVEIR